MLRSIAVSSLALCLSVVSLHASNLPGQISNDFNDGAIDTSTWQVLLPLPQTSAVEGSGSLTTSGRGMLATQADMQQSVSLRQELPYASTTLDQVTIVPEPRTYAILGLGLLGFWFLTRTTRIP